MYRDDPHILAWAQVSGARLLYTNDKCLKDDFKNKSIISHPEGTVSFTDKRKNNTIRYSRFTRSKKRLL